MSGIVAHWPVTNYNVRGHGMCSAANTRRTSDDFEVYSDNKNDKAIPVKTLHISCKSDAYRGENSKYGGVIIYQYERKIDWKTANRTHCLSGYIVIMDTESTKVKQFQYPGQYGIVHGAVYECAFGEKLNSKVVGEGFSVRNGKLEVKSASLNAPTTGPSSYHNGSRIMSEISETCVKKVVASWKAAGPQSLGCRNFEVKELLAGL